MIPTHPLESFVGQVGFVEYEVGVGRVDGNS
jgi:hypothetical protein